MDGETLDGIGIRIYLNSKLKCSKYISLGFHEAFEENYNEEHFNISYTKYCKRISNISYRK